MNGYFDKRHEQARKKRETLEGIMKIAIYKGRFEASLRYRDDWLRARCSRLVGDGLLRKEPGIHDGKLVFTPTPGAEFVI